MTHLAELLAPVCTIAQEAARLIMAHYARPIHHEKKLDHSPVTLADREANTLIVQMLAQLTPHIPIVSEEGEQPEMSETDSFWLVDPLDGTRSYIARDNQFTVNIALIEKTAPTLGVMAIPAENMLYFACTGGKAWRKLPDKQQAEIIRCRQVDMTAGLDVVVSKSYHSSRTDAFLQRYTVKGRVHAGSALKFARVAEGAADLYLRPGNTMEWDTAAGHCIIEQAGGSVTDLAGNPLRYAKPGFLNPGFLASGPGFMLF